MTASILLRPIRRAAINASCVTSPQPLSCGKLLLRSLSHVCISSISSNSMQGSTTTTTTRRRRLDAAAAVVRHWINQQPQIIMNRIFSSASYTDIISKPPYYHYHSRNHHQKIQTHQRKLKSNFHPYNNCRQLASPLSAAHFSSSIKGSNQFSSGSGDNNSSSSSSNTTTTDNKKVTTLSIIAKKRRNQKITMVTAYDYPSAVHVDRAGMDIVLVGDSCAMVELGFETTLVGCNVCARVCECTIYLSFQFEVITSFSHTLSATTISINAFLCSLSLPLSLANYIGSNDTSLPSSKKRGTKSTSSSW